MIGKNVQYKGREMRTDEGNEDNVSALPICQLFTGASKKIKE